MSTKSTALNKRDRKNRDAPRLLHFSTMSFGGLELLESVKNQSVLLYDDVHTWGNTTEAVRNMLLMAGAARVDVLTIFGTGQLMHAAHYKLVDGVNYADALYSTEPNADHFKLVDSQVVEKDELQWPEQSTTTMFH